MNEIVPPPSNLGDWTTNRLKLLLEEYTNALPGIRTLYGRGHHETRTYQLWIRALESELDKRHEQ